MTSGVKSSYGAIMRRTRWRRRRLAEPRRGDYHSLHNPESPTPHSSLPRLNLPDRLQGQIKRGREEGTANVGEKGTEFAGEMRVAREVGWVFSKEGLD